MSIDAGLAVCEKQDCHNSFIRHEHEQNMQILLTSSYKTETHHGALRRLWREHSNPFAGALKREWSVIIQSADTSY